MIRAIALDDEILALKILEKYASQSSILLLERTFNKQLDALKYLRKFPVDLIFLDIEMPSKSGLDLLKEFSQSVQVIFTTAYSDYAVKAFEVNAIDYLVKPFSYERFVTAIEKIDKKEEGSTKNYLLIRANYKLETVKFEDILFIKGLSDYVQIYLKNSTKITARYTMKSVLKMLPENEFIRIHRSFIVPISNIKSISNNKIYIDEFDLPIGGTYKKDIRRLIFKT